jgi:hypothetical protein
MNSDDHAEIKKGRTKLTTSMFTLAVSDKSGNRIIKILIAIVTFRLTVMFTFEYVAKND